VNGAAARSSALSEASVPARIVFARIYTVAKQDSTEAEGGRTSMRSQRVACAMVVVE
jgi:hypothetical protein